MTSSTDPEVVFVLAASSIPPEQLSHSEMVSDDFDERSKV